MNPTPAQIVAEARRHIGTRYQHQAALPGVAMDCIGLLAVVAAEFGMQGAAEWARDARRRSYAAQPDPAMLAAAAAEYLVPIPLADIREGDVLAMRFNQRQPQHFAIVSSLDPRRIVHAFSPAGRVVETITTDRWRAGPARGVAAYRFPGIA